MTTPSISGSSRTLRKSVTKPGATPCPFSIDLIAAGATDSSTSQMVFTRTSGNSAMLEVRNFPCPRTPIPASTTRSPGEDSARARLLASPTTPAAIPAALRALRSRNCLRLTSRFKNSSTYEFLSFKDEYSRQPFPEDFQSH